MSESLLNQFDVIYTYTRKQAIEDGVLVDVSQTAKEAGINFPVALTFAVWDMHVVPSEKLEDYGQSISGRLWDLLWMFRLKAMRSNSSLLYFSCLFLDENEKLDEVKFKALCGPGDNAEPVITIMLPGED
ncbi:MAG TPA: hypothetical protein PLY36_08470 [Spirochaetota bacterium]|nr:hypothetical protein [Spirochaetota bacterium]